MVKIKKINKNKKKLFILIGFIILFVAILITGYLLISNKKFKDIFKYRDRITIQVGDSLPVINDYLYNDIDSDIKIEWKDVDIYDGKVYKPGIYFGSFVYDNEVKNISLVVEDNISPVIEGIKDIEITAYEAKPDLLEGITVTDNSNEDIEVLVNGEYDFEKAGTYELYYYAKDSSGNEVSMPFTLVVKENKNVSFSKTSKGFTIKNYYNITYIDDVIIANKTYSLPSNYIPSNLVTINGYIRVVDYVKDAFNELKSDATSLGLNIYASSGYRSYSDQNYIYNNYVKMDGKEKADTYSARAGYSEHQTGLAIDVNTVDMTFDNTDESNWLSNNCYKYGFIIRYPKDKESITGYMYEPWHIRYVGKDLASKLYNNGNPITLEEYYGIDSKYS